MATPHFNHLLELAQSLASSQGFYSRLYHTLTHDLTDDDIVAIEEEMTHLNLTTDLDIILWLEQ